MFIAIRIAILIAAPVAGLVLVLVSVPSLLTTVLQMYTLSRFSTYRCSLGTYERRCRRLLGIPAAQAQQRRAVKWISEVQDRMPCPFSWGKGLLAGGLESPPGEGLMQRRRCQRRACGLKPTDRL